MENFIDENGQILNQKKYDESQPTPYHSVVDGRWVFNKERCLDEFVRPVRNNLLDRIDLTYCNAERWPSLSEAEKTEVKAKKKALKDLTNNIPNDISDISEIIFPKV